MRRLSAYTFPIYGAHPSGDEVTGRPVSLVPRNSREVDVFVLAEDGTPDSWQVAVVFGGNHIPDDDPGHPFEFVCTVAVDSTDGAINGPMFGGHPNTNPVHLFRRRIV